MSHRSQTASFVPSPFMLFANAQIVTERRVDSEILQEANTHWAMQYIRDHSMMFLIQPDPEEDIPVYPRVVQSFYQTLQEFPPSTTSSTRSVYQVDVVGIRVQFTTADICACLGYPPFFNTTTGFKPPISASKDEMIDDMCQGLRDENADATRRAYLPPKMWLLDDAVRSNLCPIGHNQQRVGTILGVLYNMYRGTWFDIGKVYMESILKAKALVENKPTKVGKLFFPRLITRLLVSMGIRLPPSLSSSEYPVAVMPKSSWHQSVSHMTSSAKRRRTQVRVPLQLPEASQSSAAEPSPPPQLDHIQEIIGRLHRLEAGQQRLEHMLNVLMNVLRG